MRLPRPGRAHVHMCAHLHVWLFILLISAGMGFSRGRGHTGSVEAHLRMDHTRSQEFGAYGDTPMAESPRDFYLEEYKVPKTAHISFDRSGFDNFSSTLLVQQQRYTLGYILTKLERHCGFRSP